jgi:hypothetical protein
MNDRCVSSRLVASTGNDYNYSYARIKREGSLSSTSTSTSNSSQSSLSSSTSVPSSPIQIQPPNNLQRAFYNEGNFRDMHWYACLNMIILYSHNLGASSNKSRSADGTSLITTSGDNTIRTFILYGSDYLLICLILFLHNYFTE